jgi:putative intracellular protease/amidase
MEVKKLKLVITFIKKIAVPVDVLRRAGVSVVLAGLESSAPVLGANKITLTPEIGLSDITDLSSFDMIVLPGGTNAAL